MCGLAGILRFVPDGVAAPAASALYEAIPESWLDILEAGIAHRGPDGRGRFRDALTAPEGAALHVALVHRRLSILDLGGGAQPMLRRSRVSASSGDPSTHPSPAMSRFAPADACLIFQGAPGEALHYRKVGGGSETVQERSLAAIAFNGCIYNHRALRSTLQASGHRFESDHSDTEVILHAARQWGTSAAEHFDGMYAYALWDRESASLVLARDPAGEKPLYYTILPAPEGPGELLAFSSSAASIATLRARLGAALRPNVTAALWLKHGYWPDMPADLAELGPGRTLRFVASSFTAQASKPVLHISPRSVAAHRSTPRRSIDDESLRREIREGIVSRLDADVPIGCFLSGGVDSSIIAALAHDHLRGAGRKLRTFNVRMPDPRLDESTYATMVATHLGTDHTELDCKASAADDLVRLISQLGLPFGDSSLLPTHWVSAAARSVVTVALGGDGGDELFAGYNRYRVNTLLYQLRGPLSLLHTVPSWIPGFKLGGNLGRVATAARHHGYDDILTIFRTPQLASLLGDVVTRELLTSAYAARGTAAIGPDARTDDIDRYLPMDLLRKVDTASMAVALEVRAPFLARGLMLAATDATLREVYAGEGRKGWLRRYARTMVPAAAIDRRKQGFGAPIGRWFREDFGGLGRLLHDHLRAAEPFPGLPTPIHPAALRTILDEHHSKTRDHGQRLYALLVLSLWCKNLAHP